MTKIREVLAGVPIAAALALCVGCSATSSTPTQSYTQGHQSGESGAARMFERQGTPYNLACQEGLTADNMFADNPTLHPGPVTAVPADYLQGCMAALNGN
jgi:hypothetical protein